MKQSEVVDSFGVVEWPEDGQAEDITYSAAAREQLQRLSEGEQKKISVGIGKVYGRCLEFLVICSMQTFVHKDDLSTLEMLRRGLVTFNICEYAIRVRLCKTTLVWHVMSVGLPGSLQLYQTKKI